MMDLTLRAFKERNQITMMRTTHVVKQHLATAVFIAIASIASGCGDVATVTPVVELASLTVTTGTTTATLQPAFTGGTTEYNVNLTSDVTSVRVTAQPAVAGDTVTINGQATTSSVIPLGAAGTTTPVSIVVSESNTNSRTYTVLLVRAGLTENNSLQSLAVSPGTLAPTFDPNLQTYTVDVANNIGSVTVTPTLSDPAATMTVNGQATNSRQARTITLSPAGQDTAIPIVVTAQNNSTKIYTVTVSRGVSSNNNLQSLILSPGTLNFSPAITSYTVNVASNVTNVTIRPTVADTTATMTVNGQATDSGQAQTIPLNGPGSTTVINITVIAQNGTQRIYSVNVIRAALGGNNNLRSLAVSPGTLAPAFRTNRTGYSVSLGSNIDNLTVTATLQDAGATVMINGQGAGSGQSRPIPLEPPGSTTEIAIIVVAPNGNPRTYQIDAIREALGGNNNLSALTVSPGTLAPAFNANTMGYTLNVGSVVTSITVSATKADSNAVMSGDVSVGTGVATGQATIPLNGAGNSTPLSVTVTAPNGSPKTYSINVNRPAPTAPPAPASAPDLTPESDSGFNPGQDADNITNDLTPSFTVAPLAAGETPNLYIDGVKVKEGFDERTNTLTPTNPLPSGEYDITVTSTVTNAAGLESLPSPSLNVHIDNVAPGFP